MNLALGCFVSFALLSLPSDGNRAQPGLASPSYRFADFDRDGLLDLYVVRASGDRLFKNLGDGTFGDVTYAMGLSRETRSRIALWQDFDCDGWADLFLALGAGGARLLRNSGGTSFVDATSELGLAPDVGVVLIAEFFDLDADGRVDLHVVSERGDALLHNRGGRFAPAALPGVDPFEESVVVLPAPSVSSGSVDETTSGSGPLALGNRCPQQLKDQATGTCLNASTTPTLGALYPLSTSLNVSAAGKVGIGTTTPTANLHVVGNDGLVATGTFGSGTLASTGGGVRFLWYPRKAALRAGIAGSSSWDDANIGDYSVAMGNGTKATGGGSAAFGTAWATHDFAFAAGVAANAAGPASVAFGSTTLASGGNSAALGHSTTASGLASTSTGYDTSAESVASFAAGRANVGGGNPTTWVETDPLFEIGNGSLQTARANAVTVLKSGDVGLRTTAPEALLHVMESSAGAVTANANSIAVFERSAGGWVSILGADGNSKGMLFGNTSDPNSGGIVYDQASVATNAMQFRTGGNTTQMLIDSSGNVGIGTNSPAFLLHVDGSAGKPGGGSWSVASDERLKKNVHELRGALEKLLELRGVTFEYVDPESIGELDGERMGLIAQEVEQVFSDWVEEGRDGYKRLTVRGFEALAVEALRELRAEKDAELTELRARLERSENAIAALSDALARMSAPLDALSPAERR